MGLLRGTGDKIERRKMPNTASLEGQISSPKFGETGQSTPERKNGRKNKGIMKRARQRRENVY